MEVGGTLFLCHLYVLPQLSATSASAVQTAFRPAMELLDMLGMWIADAIDIDHEYDISEATLKTGHDASEEPREAARNIYQCQDDSRLVPCSYKRHLLQAR